MSVRTLPRRTERVLARLIHRERRAFLFQEKALARVAYLTVYHAGHGAPDPFRRAVQQLRNAWGFQLECERAPLAPPREVASPSIATVDDRDGDQWLASAIAYLHWRQGLDWRRWTQRHAADVEICSGALHTLTQIRSAPHDARRLGAFLALRTAERATSQLVLQFPARPKARPAAA